MSKNNFQGKGNIMTYIQYNNEHTLTNLFYSYNMREQLDVITNSKKKSKQHKFMWSKGMLMNCKCEQNWILHSGEKVN